MSVLHDEIINDPLAIGYAGMNDAEVAASLNAIIYPKAGLCAIPRMVSILFSSGTLATPIGAAMANPTGIESVSLEMLKLIRILGINEVDCSDPLFLGALDAAGVPAPDKEAIIAAGGTVLQSRAVLIGLIPPVTEEQVTAARAE